MLIQRKEKYGSIFFDSNTGNRFFRTNAPLRLFIDNLSLPIVCNWQITYKCNLNCKYCFIHKKNMEVKDWKKVISNLRGILILNISGGEPLLHSEFDEIVKYAFRHIPYLSLSTNGSLIKNYLNTIGKKFKRVQISLDGTEKNQLIRGVSYKKIINNIEKLHKSYPKLKISVECVLTKYNLKEIFELLEMLKYFKISISINPMVLKGKAKKEFIPKKKELKEFFINLKKRRKKYKNLKIEIDDCFPFEYQKEIYNMSKREEYCAAGRTICNITCNGRVTPCHFLERPIFGNIIKSPLKEIWNSEKRKRFLTIFSNKIPCKQLIIY